MARGPDVIADGWSHGRPDLAFLALRLASMPFWPSGPESSEANQKMLCLDWARDPKGGDPGVLMVKASARFLDAELAAKGLESLMGGSPIARSITRAIDGDFSIRMEFTAPPDPKFDAAAELFEMDLSPEERRWAAFAKQRSRGRKP